MMIATTIIQCEICDDRGVIYREQWPGAYKSSLCGCHTPEYWAEQSTTSVMLFKQRIAEIRANNGGESIGKVGNTGRQEHQLS